MDPPDHPGIAITLGGLAQLAVNRAEYDRAEDFARRSIAISEAKLGEQHPTVAATLVILAHTYMARKRYEDAERCLTRSLGIRERYLSSDHPDLHVILNYLADLFVLTGRNDQAIATADRSRRVLARHVRRILPLLAEPEQIEFLAPYGEVLEDHLSLAMMSPSDARVAELSAEWVLNGKAVVHEVLANRWRMARDQRDSSGVQLVEELIGVRAQLAAIDAEVGEGSIVDHDLIATLNDREQAIARQLGQTDVGCLAEHWASVEEVRATLPEDSVLVEIARFRRANYQTAKLEERRFAAWVIPPRGRGRVVLVDLGQAEPIEQAVRVVRQSFANAPSRIADNGESAAEDDCRRSLQVLADLIVDPLKDYLLPARQWIISPDGALWLVPWAALPLNEKQYALEKHQIRTVITGRNLVLPQVPAGTSPDMVLADPDFDLPLTKLQTATHGTGLADGLSRSPAQPRRVQPLGKRWTRLPGTAVEATAVAIELEKYSGSAPCVYTRDQAVESVVMNAHGPRVLAISTHGFFLEDQDSAGFSPADNLGQRGVFVAPERVPGKDPMSFAHQIENPLLRCGLVLAGANHGQEADSASDGDGLLTGLEIVGADLRGTDLVVLSACESAVGEVRDSEGVMGLRQAFQLAGARTVVATLWKIPDRDTTELIRAFFRHLSECHDAPESLRQGQLDVLQSRRSRNGAAHPFYWAAFTATGEPTRASSPTTPAHVTPAVQPSTAETALWHSFVLPVGIVLGVSLVTVAACCAGWCLTRSMSKRHN